LDLEQDIRKNRAAAYRILGIQLLLTAFISLLLVILSEQVSAYSVLLGGLAYILPSAYFVRFVFRTSAQQTPQILLRWFLIGETGKLVLTGVIFALCFALIRPINVIAFFMMFVLMIIVNQIALHKSRKKF
jgi:ATP synthase protein I